jgi:hypothetical protein
MDELFRRLVALSVGDGSLDVRVKVHHVAPNGRDRRVYSRINWFWEIDS